MLSAMSAMQKDPFLAISTMAKPTLHVMNVVPKERLLMFTHTTMIVIQPVMVVAKPVW
jgi:hypothetical protein